MASTKRSKQRLSKSQITKVACKHCYDSVEQRIYINTVSYLKNNHYPSMLEPRTSQTQLSKLFHEPNTKSPAQWQPYIDFYPLNNENKPITKRPKSIFFKKQITLKKNDQSITINKNEQATPRPSIKSRKTIVKKPIVSTEEQKNQSEKPIEWYVRQAIEKFQNQDYITARELWSYYESMEHSDMSQNELLAVQKELLNALKEDMILSDANALNMVEFLLKKRMKGLSIKNIEGQRPLVFCSYCQTFVGGPLSGDWRTGIPIDFDIYTVHHKDPDEFALFKRRWNFHETTDLHIDNYSLLHSGKSNYKYSDKYKREIKILVELFRTVLEMKISRIANVNYTKMLARKYKQKVDIGNQPHSRYYVPDMIETMAENAKVGIKSDVNSILPATKRQPTVHITADKGEALHKKIQLGHITYWSNEETDLVLKPIVCNELTYKNEKSGSAKNVALSLN
eukprot:355893_1